MVRQERAAMDPATRTLPSRIALLLCLAVSVAILGRQRPAPTLEQPAIHGANAVEERTVDWAVRRFREAGLRGMPQLDVYAHPSGEGCHGNFGLYYRGRIDLCTRYTTEAEARRFALHEMAHAWIESSGAAALLQRFMQRREIEVWDDRGLDWQERGSEQAAEIIAWGLGDGAIAPWIPEPTDAPTLVRLYELLTGREPITPAAD